MTESLYIDPDKISFRPNVELCNPCDLLRRARSRHTSRARLFILRVRAREKQRRARNFSSRGYAIAFQARRLAYELR